MAEKTAAQKRAQKTYMDKFAVARVRMEKEMYEAIKTHAQACGESVNAFVIRAVSETMARDNGAQGASGKV